MKAKFGAVIVGGSGSLGGHVVTKNRSGYAMRTKVTPSNPRTNAQSAIRSRLTSISQSWAGLTEAQRASWNNAVSSFQKTNVFGDKVTPSGFNLYQLCNNNLLTVGGAAITTPPSPSEVQALTSLSAVADNSSNTLVLTFSPAIDAGTNIKVYATAPLPAGQSFVKNKLRLVDVLSVGDTSPADISAAYIAKFGSVGEVGKKIHLSLVGVNNTTGQQGIGIQASTVVVA